MFNKEMPKPRITAARREIIAAYEVIKQIPGEGTMTQRVARMLNRPLDRNKSHSHIRKVIKEYRESIAN